LDLVKDAVTTHANQQGSYDPSGLLSQLTDLFMKHAPEHAGGVRPASEDPYGDPADQEPRRRAG
jgi:hypothetical protein